MTIADLARIYPNDCLRCEYRGNTKLEPHVIEMQDALASGYGHVEMHEVNDCGEGNDWICEYRSDWMPDGPGCETRLSW